MYNKSSPGVASLESRLERKHQRDADNKQKEGKDEIGRGPSIPLRMLQRPIGCAAARIVDQDHGGDCGPAKDIERHQAAWSSSGFKSWPHDFLICARYAGHVSGFYREGRITAWFRSSVSARLARSSPSNARSAKFSDW